MNNKIILILMFFMSIFFFSCGEKEKVKTEESLVNTSKFLDFDFKDAKAIASLKNSKFDTSLKRVPRGIEREEVNGFAKVLNDDTIASALNFPSTVELSSIQEIINTEANGKKYVYIIFERPIEYKYDEIKTYERKTIIEHEPDKDGNVVPPEVKIEEYTETVPRQGHLSKLICVSEDGSYQDILYPDGKEWTDRTRHLYTRDKNYKTDSKGNFYFEIEDIESTCLYKYNPEKKELTQLTAKGIEGIRAGKFELNEDSNGIFINLYVEAVEDKPGIERFEYIPLDNPDNPIIILDDQRCQNFIYRKENQKLYYFCFNSKETFSAGLYKVGNWDKIQSTEDLNQYTKKVTVLSDYESGFDPFIYGKLYSDEYGVWMKPTKKYPFILLSEDETGTDKFDCYPYENLSRVEKNGDKFLFTQDLFVEFEGDLICTNKQKLILFDAKTKEYTDLFEVSQVPNIYGFNIISFSCTENKVYFTAEKGRNVSSGVIDLTTMKYAPFKTDAKLDLIRTF